MLIHGNSLYIPIADKKAQMACTSPPYYGLRDYQISGQLGLEPTLQEYIDNTVLWCREVRRVLRDDGTFWLNLGDSYNGSGGPGSQYDSKATGGYKGEFKKYDNPNKKQIGFKPKDLMMVPHRVAIALQDDGWYVRSDIVWHKPNPMPESVQDRPTKSHEYIFLLAKQKKYFYDADAVREPQKELGRVQHHGGGIRKDAGRHEDRRDHNNRASLYNPLGRNKHSVWTITTKPYPGAHFATFPPEIPETCIKAGTSEKGVCPVCGAQWVRETDVNYTLMQKTNNPRNVSADGKTGYSEMPRMDKHIKTIGWKPTCNHNEKPVPALVLDPFCGSGTTVAVANALGRKGIGIDLSWDYLQLAKERTGQKALEEWMNGKKAEANLEDLPLFSQEL